MECVTCKHCGEKYLGFVDYPTCTECGKGRYEPVMSLEEKIALYSPREVTKKSYHSMDVVNGIWV